MKFFITTLSLFIYSLSLFAQTVTVNWNDVRQQIDGFGASDAWFADELMQHPQREEILDVLFDKETGAGLSIVRHRVPPLIADFDDSGMDLVSGDLDMGTRPFIGIRFVNISIPKGAVVASAYIQFKAKDNLSDPSQLTITGAVSDSPGPFTSEPANISSRPRTSASVIWNVPPWKDGEYSVKQKTPDLREIVQELVNHNSWQSGSSMVFIIEGMTGKRSAHGFDSSTKPEPELVIEFDTTIFQTKVAASSDDAEENGISYVSCGAHVTKEAFARGCEKVWAAAWSPPVAWKTNNNLSQGGFLKEQHYQDWADYLENYRAEMEKRSGIPLYAISPQNEPGSKPWESCQWSSSTFRDFIKNNLGPTLNKNCKIIVPEETNWNDVDNFYQLIHNDAATRGFVDIIAGHVYGGDPNISYNHFGKPVWETEWSYDTSTDDTGINNGVEWAHNFWKLLVNAEVSAVHHWWLVNFQNDGKQQGLTSAAPLVPGLTVAKRLWTLGNYSKFVRPGWNRIAATKTPINDVYIAAFKNAATGEFAIVAINRTTATQTITFNLNDFEAALVTPHVTSAQQNLQQIEDIKAGASFEADLSGKTVTTFVGFATTSSLSEKTAHTPATFHLQQNYPNPFNASTTIDYSLGREAGVELSIFDMSGRRVHILVSGNQRAGRHSVRWSATDTPSGRVLSSGVYLCRLRAESGQDVTDCTEKMIVIK